MAENVITVYHCTEYVKIFLFPIGYKWNEKK